MNLLSLECAHVRDDVPLEDVLVGKVCCCDVDTVGMGKNHCIPGDDSELNPEMEILFMLFGRSVSNFTKTSPAFRIVPFPFFDPAVTPAR